MEGHFDVMIVNESPNKDDDYHGVPLLNDSGRRLDAFIKEAGLDPARVYITNLVRCKPPKRKPSVPEIKTCKDAHLIPEILAVKPKVIILLGNLTLRLFNLHNQGGINNIHGKVYDVALPNVPDSPTFKVIPTFNPAAFVYKSNRQLEARVVNDYRNAAKVLADKEPNAPMTANYKLIQTLEDVDELVANLREHKVFAFDTESCRLPWTVAPLLCYSFCWGFPNKTAVLPLYSHDPDGIPWKIKPRWSAEERKLLHDKLATAFEDEEIAKAAHNIKYDTNTLRFWSNKSEGSIRLKGFFYDTMVMHHTLNEEPPHNLEALADEEFGYGDYSAKKREITGHGKQLRRTYDHVPDDLLWEYAATDAEACFRLLVTYYHRFQEKPHLWNLYCEESEPLLHALAEAEWRGCELDEDVVAKLLVEYKENQDELLKNMREQTNPQFNPLSNPQLVQVLIDMGHKDKIMDPKSASGYSANKKVLTTIQDDVPIAKDILQYRTNRKMISTYLENALKDVDQDGRLRYSWFPLTVTGRLSCRFYHQIPRPDVARVKAGLPVLRDMIRARKGYKFIYGDYSQVELRILAILAQDEEMLRILDDPEGDLHAATCFEFLAPKIQGYTEAKAREDKDNRNEVGKRVNFGLAYGSQGHALVKTAKWLDADGNWRPFTWGMLEEGMKRWRSRFKGVGKFIEDAPDLARMNNNIMVNVFGRERRFGSRLSLADEFQRGEAERECINFPIQSVSGGITNRTIILMHQWLQKLIASGQIQEDDAYLVNTVHDSVMYEVRDYLVDWFCDVLRQAAQRPIPQLDGRSFRMDVGVGKTWTEAEMKG